ncbi:hypothetical protein X975_05893, partial [Stegodyphus mimosarum]
MYFRNEHIFTHTGEKSQACARYSSSFKFNGHLAIHVLISSQEKSHENVICNKLFACKSDLAEEFTKKSCLCKGIFQISASNV